ncbi:hypothetical protein NDU88_002606 [Pleurodeles waltl]|uniref:Uncharacterized protein n=1 Tax=Pleurodeles waltl TaxID=8319 RepID=A0AAV7SCH6_PLEWA|nr:hypothetical protein NDU88_002606 [Pleurodeles waltl]
MPAMVRLLAAEEQSGKNQFGQRRGPCHLRRRAALSPRDRVPALAPAGLLGASASQTAAILAAASPRDARLEVLSSARGRPRPDGSAPMTALGGAGEEEEAEGRGRSRRTARPVGGVPR